MRTEYLLDRDVEIVLAALTETFDADESVIAADLDAFLHKAREAGILDE